MSTNLEKEIARLDIRQQPVDQRVPHVFHMSVGTQVHLARERH